MDNTYKGYEIDALEALFNKVCDPEDWKAPIAVVCKGEAVNPTVAAIEFYTATNPKVSVDVNTMNYLIDKRYKQMLVCLIICKS